MKKTRYIPYGYTVQNGTTVVEHSEAEVIRRIFESYINGNSLKDIADELTRLKVPYTEKTSVWDKARIARIIENAKYIGDREYAPIIDEEIYESAVQCKIARKTNQMRSDSETIRFLRDRVKCGECGYPMTRTLQSSCKIKERWTCTNPECGCRVRISDSVLIEKVTMLINRIIENSALLETGKEHRKKDTPPCIQHMTEEIMAEAASPTGSEQLILDRIIEIAKERYRNSNIEKELALRIAKRQTEYMKAQNDFNRDYFQSLISYVTIGSDGTVGVRTKADTTVKEDITEHGREVYDAIKDMHDMRLDEYEQLDEDTQKALIRLGTYSMLQRSGYDMSSVEEEIQADKSACLHIIGNKDLLFSPCQTLRRQRVEAALGIQLGVGTDSHHSFDTFESAVNEREALAAMQVWNLNIPEGAATELLTEPEDVDFLGRVNDLLASGYSSNEIVALLFEYYSDATQTTFYPLIATLFKIMGFKCSFSRPGDNGARWDAIIDDPVRSTTLLPMKNPRHIPAATPQPRRI